VAAKTLEEFYKEYRAGFNSVTGNQNLFKDITDQMIWDAATKATVEKLAAINERVFNKLSETLNLNVP
jgi:hypothetical protein